ncbi:MAG TPA: LysR family transcriptional regulator [Tepidiformaceae bacterium]|nr:LysR family transcriptional regulator [Tepidiformaceae bacterium]
MDGGLSPRIKLWLEQDGKLVMSDYRVRLLSIVADTNSLAQAASAMKLSYRRAWGKVKEMEENLGYPLVHSEVGGAGGGHTTLTPEGERLVRAYQRFQERIALALEKSFAEEFEEPSKSSR